MGKYLILWEMDTSRVPISPQERGSAWSPMIDMVKQDMEKGRIKDWGAFVGEINGYVVVEGTEVEIGNYTQQFVPFANFKTHAISSLSQQGEVIKALSK